MAGLRGSDGDRVESPLPGVMVRCEGCGDLLRFLTRFHGRALCRECIGAETVRGCRR